MSAGEETGEDLPSFILFRVWQKWQLQLLSSVRCLQCCLGWGWVTGAGVSPSGAGFPLLRPSGCSALLMRVGPAWWCALTAQQDLLQSLPWLLQLHSSLERSFAPVHDSFFPPPPPQTVVFMALKYPSDGGISHLVLSCLELLQDTEGASAVAEKQHKVLTELKREQVMLQEQLGLIASNCPPPPQLHAALGGGWSKI